MKGWKAKSNVEGMPNDSEKEKDPTALVETHEAGAHDQRHLKCAN